MLWTHPVTTVIKRPEQVTSVTTKQMPMTTLQNVRLYFFLVGLYISSEELLSKSLRVCSMVSLSLGSAAAEAQAPPVVLRSADGLASALTISSMSSDSDNRVVAVPVLGSPAVTGGASSFVGRDRVLGRPPEGDSAVPEDAAEDAASGLACGAVPLWEAFRLVSSMDDLLSLSASMSPGQPASQPALCNVTQNPALSPIQIYSSQNLMVGLMARAECQWGQDGAGSVASHTRASLAGAPGGQTS